jgi:hypothetical protein
MPSRIQAELRAEGVLIGWGAGGGMVTVQSNRGRTPCTSFDGMIAHAVSPVSNSLIATTAVFHYGATAIESSLPVSLT